MAASTDSPAHKDMPTLLVGISGCSSSGKTTLAYHLHKLFDASLVPTQAVLIQQDQFFVDRGNSPPVRFKPHLPSDAQVMGPFKPDSEGMVMGIDRDWIGSIDWEKFERRVMDLEDGEHTSNGPMVDNLPAQALETEMAQVSQHCLQRAREKVAAICAEQVQINKDLAAKGLAHPGSYFKARAACGGDAPEASLACRIGIVEGFLLFARSPAAPEPHQTHQMRVERALHSKLFLRAEYEVSLARRFARPDYRNPDDGGGRRLPGQLWKAKGYFMDVAWEHYENYHRYIFDGLKHPNAQDQAIRNLHVHLNGKAGTDEVFLWAVERILARLVDLEDAKREKLC